MEPLKPSVMLPQIEDLPNVLRQNIKVYAQIVENVITRVEAESLNRCYILGDGDSFHASLSAEMAFNTIANVPCESYSAQRFLDYKVEWLPVDNPNGTLVVGVSASGTTRRVISSLERASEKGTITIAITGRPDSAITKVTERVICTELPNMGPAPGMRSYMASLLGYYLLSIRLGELRGYLQMDESANTRQELMDLSEVLQATIKAVDKPAKAAAEAFSDSPVIVFIGSGPSYGTAIFSAAKVIEAAGVFSMGQDLEEWTHVEFFAYPQNTPTFLIAPPGNSHWRAVELADMVKSFGRRLAVVVMENDTSITQYSDIVMPVIGKVREEFSPLIYHVAADYFSYYLTKILGRHLFQSDNESFQEANRRYLARDRIK